MQSINKNYLVFGLSFLIFFSIILDWPQEIICGLTVILYFYVVGDGQRRIIYGFVGVAIFLLPSLFLFITTKKIAYLIILYSYMVFSQLFVIQVRKPTSIRNYKFKKRLKINLIWIIFFAIHLLVTLYFLNSGFEEEIWLLGYIGLNILFERSLSNRNNAEIKIFFGIICVYLIYYSTFVWSGFGRLVILTYLLIPYLIYCCYKNKYPRRLSLIVLTLTGLFVAQASRVSEFEDWGSLFAGSAGHHLIVTLDAYSLYFDHAAPDVSAVDQLSLMFASWIPRSIWENKPIGLGYSSVRFMYPEFNFPIDYSQSVGFIGESIILSGGYVLVLPSFLLALFLIRRICTNLFLDSILPAVIFNATTASYLWGGGASFGSRFWVPFVIFVFIKFMMRIFDSIFINPFKKSSLTFSSESNSPL